MEILFLASRTPFPPDRGDRVRAFHFLQTLSADHEIDLATFVEEPMGEEARAELRRYCRRVEEVVLPRSRSVARAGLGLLSARPLQVHYYRDRRFARLISGMAARARYELVFSHLFRVFPYAGLAGDRYRLVDLTDVVSREVAASAPHRPIPSRWVYGLEAGRIRRFERHVCREADEVWVISEAEKEALLAWEPSARISVVPNGLGSEFLDEPRGTPEPDRIGFLGHLGVFHNADAIRRFCDGILPRVRRELPGASFHVAGQGGSPIVNLLARRDGVKVVGYVSDLLVFFRSNSLFVAPLRFAAGTQNKVIQAMAAGIPALVSPEVARGIGARVGEEILVADSDEEWARLALQVLRDGERARRIGDAGRRFALQRFTWDRAKARMREISGALRT